jgi:hypothetical protein
MLETFTAARIPQLGHSINKLLTSKRRKYSPKDLECHAWLEKQIKKDKAKIQATARRGVLTTGYSLPQT